MPCCLVLCVYNSAIRPRSSPSTSSRLECCPAASRRLISSPPPRRPSFCSPRSLSRQPENVLLDKKGGIKLTGFALAGLFDPSIGDDVANLLHATCGTPDYIAPEVRVFVCVRACVCVLCCVCVCVCVGEREREERHQQSNSARFMYRVLHDTVRRERVLFSQQIFEE